MTTESPAAGGSPSWESPTLALRLLGAGGALVVALYLWPLLPALVVSAVAAALVVPLQRRAERRWFPPGMVAFVATLAVFLLILLPLTGLSILIGREAAAGIRWLESEAPTLLGPGSMMEGAARAILSRIGLSSVEITPLLAQQLDQVASLMASRSVAFVSGLGGWLVQAGVALFTLYYLLRDADAVQKAICWFVPLREAQTRRLLARARDVTYATVVGNLLVAVVQGALGGVAFWVVGLPSPALWGTVMGVLSLLPVVGAPVVWVPGGLHLLSVGRIPQALGLLLFGFLVIGTV
ncbi:MAG TPA: AI-2E family transporter, partial [Longimicrobiales bacterium]|nr:AI-2E family transporter [Longimicrobiales bacterium]